jgi:hypothetical protein
VKMGVHVGIVHLAVRTLFITKETRQFVLGQNRRYIEKSPKVILPDQSIVFGINEEIVLIQPVGENPLVGDMRASRLDRLSWRDADTPSLLDPFY